MSPKAAAQTLSEEQSLYADFFRGKTVVVTGASGYIGRALCGALMEFACEVRVLSRNPPFFSQGRGRCVPCRVDLTLEEKDWGKCFEAADIVFHLAAQTSARAADEDPGMDYRINVEPLLRMLKEFKSHVSAPVVIFAGTVTQTGIPQSLPVDETHPDSPVTVYDLHKKIAEDYLLFAARKGRVRGVSLRLSNIFGPGAEESSGDRGFLNRMIKNAKNGGLLTVFEDGNYLRDFLYIEDAVCAFLSAAVHASPLSGNYFVIGSGSGHTIKEALEALRQEAFSLTGKIPELRAVIPETGLSLIETRNFVANNQKFSRITGWKPKVSLLEGLVKSLQEMR